MCVLKAFPIYLFHTELIPFASAFASAGPEAEGGHAGGGCDVIEGPVLPGPAQSGGNQ